MAEALEFPVAYCPTCDERGPIVVQDIEDIESDHVFTVLFCPQCMTLLNKGDNEVKVEWFTQEDIAEITGWRVVEDG